MRDHAPITIDDFNGLWQRGDADACPLDHFLEATNIQYFEGGFETRDGIDLYQTASILSDVLRIHPYKMMTGLTLLVLTEGGDIHHVVSPSSTFSSILSIPTMTDFNVVSWAGRAYITPFYTDADGIERGIEDEFLYVYQGAGVAARKAAGDPPTGTLAVANGAAGNMDEGLHLFGVVFESDTGWLSPPAAFVSFTTTALKTVRFSSIPVSLQSHITKRHIVATRKIEQFSGDLDGYEYAFIPGATINDNVTTVLADVGFFDIDLLEDASHLLDNFAEIPAGVGLCTYHGRLCLTTTFADISVAYLSEAGEPEAINQVDGLLIVPLDGNPLTNCTEYRDVLYLFKPVRTVGYHDNQDVPATWQSFIVDEAAGCPVHGIASVLDSGAVNVDYLIIGNYSGVFLFNGGFQEQQLTHKIYDFWQLLDRNEFRDIEIINDTITGRFYVILPTGNILFCDYNNGLTFEAVKWAHWTYQVVITTAEIININEIVLGSNGEEH
jgi:hypothetical protein